MHVDALPRVRGILDRNQPADRDAQLAHALTPGFEVGHALAHQHRGLLLLGVLSVVRDSHLFRGGFSNNILPRSLELHGLLRCADLRRYCLNILPELAPRKIFTQNDSDDVFSGLLGDVRLGQRTHPIDDLVDRLVSNATTATAATSSSGAAASCGRPRARCATATSACCTTRGWCLLFRKSGFKTLTAPAIIFHRRRPSGVGPGRRPRWRVGWRSGIYALTTSRP